MTDYAFTTIDALHLELAIKELEMFDRAESMADQAIDDLNDFCELLTLRADYNWLRDQVLLIMPLGIQTWIDKRLVQKWAHAAGIDHIADALIYELSLMGSRNALNRLNRELASIDA